MKVGTNIEVEALLVSGRRSLLAEIRHWLYVPRRHEMGHVGRTGRTEDGRTLTSAVHRAPIRATICQVQSVARSGSLSDRRVGDLRTPIDRRRWFVLLFAQ